MTYYLFALVFTAWSACCLFTAAWLAHQLSKRIGEGWALLAGGPIMGAGVWAAIYPLKLAIAQYASALGIVP